MRILNYFIFGLYYHIRIYIRHDTLSTQQRIIQQSKDVIKNREVDNEVSKTIDDEGIITII